MIELLLISGTLQVTNYKIRVTRYVLQDTCYKLEVTVTVFEIKQVFCTSKLHELQTS